MRLPKTITRMISSYLSISILVFSLHVPAYGAMVSTTELVAVQQSEQQRDRLRSVLTREEVREQLVNWGVDPDEALTRVDSMTDSEVRMLSAKLDEMPAGGDVLTALVLIFLILLVTDILGYTDIFPFVKKPH